MKVGVVGARLAGSYAAWLLADAGHEVLLFDPTPEREKPCGGGVTFKALRRMPWLRSLDLPHTRITRLELAGPREAAKLALPHPIHIFARSTLDAYLQERACGARARFHAERAVGFERLPRGWGIRTDGGTHEVELLVGADGATSALR